jgi:hypothetical protein
VYTLVRVKDLHVIYIIKESARTTQLANERDLNAWRYVFPKLSGESGLV